MGILSTNEFWLILFLAVSGYLLYARKSGENTKSKNKNA